jgi:hypothetical protein
MVKAVTDILVIGRKVYRVCGDCGEIVRWNKPLIGSLHFCTTDEERKQYPQQIRARAAFNLAALTNVKQR